MQLNTLANFNLYFYSLQNTDLFNSLECRGNYSAISNNMKLVHWSLMGGLLHLVQRGGDWAGRLLAVPICDVPRLDVEYC